MKNRRKFFVLAMAMMMILILSISLVACNKSKNDPETRPFSMSIQTPDGVFNPFFSTSAYDSQVIGLTQISMLNTGKDDDNGYIVYGENEPTVVQDYTTTQNAVGTKYDFLIKNGIKFSDGTPLTIKDVLFNLYVYLDPAFTGSATIYSTDIVGLKNYRTQTVGEQTESGEAAWEAGFRAKAVTRINTLIDYIGCFGRGLNSAKKNWHDGWQAEGVKWDSDIFKNYQDGDGNTFNFIQDYETIKAEFKKELESDWRAINVEDYKDWGGFTEAWRIYMFNDAGYTDFLKHETEGDPNSPFLKNDKDNYVIDDELAQNFYYTEIMDSILRDPNYGGDPNFNPASEQELKNAANQYVANHTKDQLNAAIQNYCVNRVFQTYFPAGGIPATQYTSFQSVVRYWQTADTVLTNFTAEEKSKYFKGTGMQVESISGITVSKVQTFNAKQLDGDHYVLSIQINDVDPKAIYNFSFTVSPMHYYSSPELAEAFDKNFAKWEQDPVNNPLRGFGVDFSNPDFMNNVVNASDKVKVPVGAGPYMACDSNGNTDHNSAEKGFFDLNIIYYVRNPYFETVGSGLNNANIKYVRYKVVESDQIINSLGRDIDFGDPSATDDNLNSIKRAGLEYVQTETSGYGYVGINPRFVPNINVRRAIMKAFNTNIIIQNYYKNNFATIIQRPMSTTSWAYPKGVGVYTSENGTSYAFDSDGKEIENLVKAAGYHPNGNGVYEKVIEGYGTDTLDYKFTIAGGSTDHPAYAMFLEAAKLLNAHGFNVRVVTSATALSDLSAGKLEVWAAAWSSTIDPDMYQVYHKQSQASSVNNWGYKQILANDAVYGTEQRIVNALSDLIDQGRTSLDQDERMATYAQALDKVMELAVEFPTYQRYDLSAYNGKVIDKNSLPAEDDCGPYYGLLSRIWEVRYR